MKAVILGSAICGIRKALECKRLGYEVLVAAESTYLGEDITATWAYYGAASEEKAIRLLAELGISMQRPVLPGKVKKAVLSLLLEHQIEILYMAKPLGVKLENGAVQGVLLGMKNGIRLVPCDELYDGSAYGTASVPILGGHVLIPAGEVAAVRLEYQNIHMDTEICTMDAQTSFERGCVKPGHAYLNVGMKFDRDTRLDAALEALWSRSTVVAQKIAASAEFAESELMNALPHTLICNAILRKSAQKIVLREQKNGIISMNHRTNSFYEENGKILFRDSSDLPSRSTRVLVAGAGTGGIQAALAAAESGADVLLAEFFSHPGGTRTMGGIAFLYYGNRNAFFRKKMAEIKRFAHTVSANFSDSRYSAGEAMLYHRMLRERNVDFRARAIVCGAQVQNGRVASVLLACDDGILCVHPQFVVDGTGDGDVASFAGVKTEIGDSETGFVQNYSHGNRTSRTTFDKPGADRDTMRPDLTSEWTRALNLDTLDAADYDMNEMLTVRESARIFGKFRVTHADVVRGRVEPDALVDAYSTYDAHARSMNIIGRLGYLPEEGKPRFCSIPYRALLVKEADNLIVVGKAISMDQDAFNYYRMCPDIMTLGAIAGKITASAQKLDEFDISGIQREMLEAGALIRVPREDTWYEFPAKRVVVPLLAGDEGGVREAVLSGWENIPQMLVGALEDDCCQSQEAAHRVLLWFGDVSGAAEILALLIRHDKAFGAAEYDDRRPSGLISGGIYNKMNDYWYVNQAAVLLAMAQYRQAVPAIAAAMNATVCGGYYKPETVTYGSLRVDALTNANYDRMLCLAEAAIRMPDPEFKKPLMRLCGLASQAVLDNDNVYQRFLELKTAYAAYICGWDEAVDTVLRYAQDPHAVLREYARRLLKREAHHGK